MKKQLLLAILMLLPLVASADGVEIDGLNYNLNTEDKTASVTYQFLVGDFGQSDFYSGEIVIPESVVYEGVTYRVTAIGEYAFSCSPATSVTIPNGVTSIGRMAFFQCGSLTSVSIPNSVTSIGISAFAWCDGLTSLPISSSVISIGEWAFEGTSWYNNQPDGIVYAGKVLYEYKGIMPEGTSISIEEGTLGIAEGAFYECSGLTSVTIPASVISICDGAFGKCGGLGSIVVDKGNPYYDSRNNCNAIIEKSTNSLIVGCKNTVIPNDVISIGNSAFLGCGGLSSVALPNSVTSIGKNSFCLSGLTSVSLPNSLTSIGESAFGLCGLLSSVTIPSSVTSIGDFAFVQSGLTSVTISNGVTSIGNSAFQQCRGLTSVTIPNSVTSIGEGAFSATSLASVTIPSSVTSIVNNPFTGCPNLTQIIVEDNNPVYDSRDNCNAIIETKSNKLVASSPTTIIPNSVTAIGNFAFAGYNQSSVAIPNSVTSIGDYAFGGSSITTLEIPNSVTSIGVSAFTACENLTSLIIPYGVTSISYATFEGCPNLTSVTIPNSVTSIGQFAFNCCWALKSITIPNSVSSIGIQAFSQCKSLETVTLPSSVTSIGACCFERCESLADFYCYALSPPSIFEGFAYSNTANATLHVPASKIEEYKAAEPWKNFKEIVALDDSGDNTFPITIGKSGKLSFCGTLSLDFSFSDEVKAYIATGYDKDAEIIWLTRVMDVPAGVPVLIKGEAGKTYNIPVTDSQNSYYKNMFKGNTVGSPIQVKATEGNLVNYYLSGEGVFKSVNGYANIGNMKCYLQLPSTFNPAVTGSSQMVTVGTSGKASYAAPVDLDFTNVSGLKAFTATGYDKSTKTIWLTRVMKAQKGEGLLLKGDPKEYEIPSVDVQSHYENMFVGNISGDRIEVWQNSEDGSSTNFYLATDGTFKSVNGYVYLGNNKSYLALPSPLVSFPSTRSAEESYMLDEPEMISMPIVRSIESDDDGTTDLTPALSEGEGEWYTLQGQRVAKPGKGVYIKNGKMVVIK